MIRASAEPAPDRLSKIEQIVSDAELYQSPELKEFGIEIDPKPMEAEGVVLQAPTLLQRDNVEIKVNNGQWRTKQLYKVQNRKGKRLTDGMTLNYITIFIRDQSSRIDPKRDFEDKFLKGFIKTGQEVRLANAFVQSTFIILAWNQCRTAS